MNPIILSAVSEIALDLFRRFLEPRPSGESAAVEESAPAPQDWEEAYAQLVAYSEERAKIDEEQSQVIVKIAEKVDAIAVEQQQFQERVEAFMASARRIQIITMLGALCGVAALIVVVLK